MKGACRLFGWPLQEVGVCCLYMFDFYEWHIFSSVRPLCFKERLLGLLRHFVLLALFLA